MANIKECQFFLSKFPLDEAAQETIKDHFINLELINVNGNIYIRNNHSIPKTMEEFLMPSDGVKQIAYHYDSEQIGIGSGSFQQYDKCYTKYKSFYMAISTLLAAQTYISSGKKPLQSELTFSYLSHRMIQSMKQKEHVSISIDPKN